MKFNNLLNNFSAGEWSPKMKARSEVQQYFQACETMLNFIPKTQGGAFRRPGTIVADYTGDATLNSNLQLALSHPDGFGSDSTVLSKMIPRVLSDGTKQILIANNYHPNTWVVVNVNSPHYSSALSIGSIFSGAEFTTTSASMKFAQVGDVVFITDGTGNNPPRVWIPSNFGGGSLKLLSDYLSDQPWKWTPYLPINANSTNLWITNSATTGTITLTSSIAWFDTAHVGTYMKFSTNGHTGVVKITGYTSPQSVTATVLVNLFSTGNYGNDGNPGSSFEEQAWSGYHGWPKTVVSYQGRVIFGGSERYPDTIWASRIGNVFDMMERPFQQYAEYTAFPTDNSRPFTMTPSSKEASNIVALSADKSLLIHTDRTEIVGYGTNGALGPLDVTFDSSSNNGSTLAMPVRSNGFSVFVQKGGRKLRDTVFNFEQDQFKSSDLSFVADHLTLDTEGQERDVIVEIVSQTADSSHVWAKTQNGRLLCLTLDRDYQINAWSQAKLGGSSGIRTWPLVKSMCVVEGPNSEGDRLFLLTQRVKTHGTYVVGDGSLSSFNGQMVFANGDGTDLGYFLVSGGNIDLPPATYTTITIRVSFISLEYMDIPFEFEDIDMYSSAIGHMDYKTMQSILAGVSTFTVTTSLAGENVQVIANGVYLGEFPVATNGSVTITGHDTSIINYLIIGLKAPALLKTMPIELGQQVPGSPQGFIKRVDQLLIKFFLSKGCKYGYKADDLLTIDFSDVAADKLFTGLKEVRFPSDYSRECQAIISTETPYPCNIISVIAKGMLYD